MGSVKMPTSSVGSVWPAWETAIVAAMVSAPKCGSATCREQARARADRAGDGRLRGSGCGHGVLDGLVLRGDERVQRRGVGLGLGPGPLGTGAFGLETVGQRLEFDDAGVEHVGVGLRVGLGPGQIGGTGGVERAERLRGGARRGTR